MEKRNWYNKESFYYYTPNGKIFWYAFSKQNVKNLPVIIYLRGWNNIQTKKDILKSEMDFDIKPLIEAGYFVIVTMYSGWFKSDWKDEYWWEDIKDVLALRNVLVNKFYNKININKIWIFWFSRWWMMWYIIRSLSISWIKFYVIVSAPSDLVMFSKERPLVYKNVFLIAFWWQEVDLIDRSRVKKKIKKKWIPMLIIHGKNDEKVSFNHFIKSRTYCRDNEIKADFLYSNLLGHWVDKPMMNKILTWLSQVFNK